MVKQHPVYIILLYIVFAVAIPASAGTDSCSTIVLKDMAEKLKRSGHPLSDGLRLRTAFLGERQVEVVRNSNGVVTHLGYPLFPHGMKSEGHTAVVFRFAERYLLHLSLCSNVERAGYLRDDGVTLYPSQPAFIDSTCCVELTENPQHYTLKWVSASGRETVMTFPKSYELISGRNKIERDEFLRRLLCSGDYADTLITEKKQINPLELLKVDSMGYYVRKGDSHIFSTLNRNVYYRRDSLGDYRPLCDADCLAETFHNVLTGQLGTLIKLNVVHKLYGKREACYSVSLNRMLNIFMKQGCLPYAGVENITADGGIVGTVIFMNREFGYNHLLYVETDGKTLESCKGGVKAKLYSYVPTHNLKSLFTDKELKKWEK